jgi:hypothetical protein
MGGSHVIGTSRRLGIAGLGVVAAILVSPASGAGRNLSIEGGTVREQSQVRAALEASSFDWSVLPQLVTIRISRGEASSAIPGEIGLDANLLDAGTFSWGVIQHEFAHEIDFLLLDDADRTRLQLLLGASSWWPVDGLPHAQLGCERFASTLAWAYWPSPGNIMRPSSPSDEAGSVAPEAFRRLLRGIIRAHEIQAVSSNLTPR